MSDMQQTIDRQAIMEPHAEYLDQIIERAVTEAAKAMLRFPQPDSIPPLTKMSEEAGELVKAAVHLSEGRDYTPADYEQEAVQTIAMVLRLLIEGDQTHGLRPVADMLAKGGKADE